MNRDHQNFHSMVRAVLQTRVAHPEATSAPVALVRMLDSVAGLEALLNSQRRAQGIGLEPIAAAKDTLKELMARAVCVVLGAVEAFASVTGRTKLVMQAHAVPSDMMGLGDMEAANHAVNLLSLVTTDILPVLKAEYGLTDAVLNEAQGVTDEFAHAVGLPRAGIVERESHEGVIEWVVGELRRVLTTQLDVLARQFDLQPKDSGSLTKKAWFDAYTSGRVIVDLAPGSGGGGDVPPVPPVVPTT